MKTPLDIVKKMREAIMDHQQANGFETVFDFLNEDLEDLEKALATSDIVFSESELKAKLEEQKEEIRQWLIDEDFEGLAERL